MPQSNLPPIPSSELENLNTDFVTPVGSVITYAGKITNTSVMMLAAAGWLVCDGRGLSVKEFPELFSSLEYTYGGVNSEFNIPKIPKVDLGNNNFLTSLIKYTY